MILTGRQANGNGKEYRNSRGQRQSPGGKDQGADLPPALLLHPLSLHLHVIVTLLKEKFVDELHWIDEEEMLDLVAIAQSSPGAIAVNGAIVLGYRMAGIPGVIVSVLGSVIPPVVILTVISFFYTAFKSNVWIQALLRGMTAGVSAVILSVVWDMTAGLVKQKDLSLLIVAVLAFAANYFFRLNVIFIILVCAVFGVIRTLLRERRARG